MYAPKTNNNRSSFLRVPTALARRKDLSPSAKFVAAALMFHGRKDSAIFPSLPLLAELTGLGGKTVWRSIRQLCKTGDFRAVRPDRTKSNQYYPSPELASLFGYEGETTATPTGHNYESSERPANSNNIASIDKVRDTRTRKPKDNSKDTRAVLVGSIDSIGRTSQNDESSLPSLERVESDGLKSYLRSWGMGANVADRLIREYPEFSIRRQALWLPLRSPKTNPAGYLRRAIEESFSPLKLTDAQRAWVEDAVASHMLPVPDPALRNLSEKNLDTWKDDFLAERTAEADAWYADRDAAARSAEQLSYDDEEEFPI